MQHKDPGTLATPEPIVRLSLHDQLLGRLRAMIIEGELLPEAKIDEKDLCARFGVSRTPLREALKVLASEGLVTLIAHRGAIVSPLDMDELSAAFPVMGTLEALAGGTCRKARDRLGDRRNRTLAGATRRYASCGQSARLLRDQQDDP